jgi:hypothetical protein
MTDNAEMGEQPADPATRGGVGVGAVPDDYADGVAEEQMETSGHAASAPGTSPEEADGGRPAPVHFADSGAAEAEMSTVNDWGTGPDEPQGPPSAERGETDQS